MTSLSRVSLYANSSGIEGGSDGNKKSIVNIYDYDDEGEALTTLIKAQNGGGGGMSATAEKKKRLSLPSRPPLPPLPYRNKLFGLRPPLTFAAALTRASEK